jgi:lysophospholipase L1-like esterase
VRPDRSTTDRPSFAAVCRLPIIAAIVATVLVLPISIANAAGQSGPYNALGDSYSSGVGTGSASGPCGQSVKAYPQLWRSANKPAQFAFLACGGATISDVTRQVADPRFQAAGTLVTLTAGGNDVGFGAVVSTCTTGTDAACNTVVENGIKIANSSKFRADFLALFQQIHSADPTSKIIVLGYPRLFETSAVCFAVAPSQSRRININRGAVALKNAIVAAVSDSANAGRNVQFVDVDSYFTNHRVCSISPWINGATVPTGESYHPNAKGQANAYLPALTSATSRLAPSPAQTSAP